MQGQTQASVARPVRGGGCCEQAINYLEPGQSPLLEKETKPMRSICPSPRAAASRRDLLGGPLQSRSSEGRRWWAEAGTHHDAGEQTDALPTVRVGHHVPVPDGQECDGDEPHGAQEVTGDVLLVMVPAEGETGL